MPNENLFETKVTPDNSEVKPTVSSPETPSIPPELVEFVGVGKKYSSIEEALKSVPHAQKHISTIEAELATVKEELTKRTAAEEILNELRTKGITPPTEPTVTKGLSQEDIQKVVEQTLVKSEAQKTIKVNKEKVVDAFTAKFGDKAREVYEAVATESGLSVEYLNSLAGTSPSAVLKLAGIDSKKVVETSIKKGSINTEALKPNENSTSSSKVTGTGTKDMVAAWRRAGELIGKTT